MQAAQNVTKKYDMIIAMFEEMQRFTDRLKILVRHGAMDDDLRKEVVKTMAIILKFIGVVEKAIRDGRTGTCCSLPQKAKLLRFHPPCLKPNPASQ